MKAMIFAAGRGDRLRPLTDKRPKPLLKVGSDSLIEHHIKKLAAAGFESVVINTAHLGEQLQEYLGNGTKYNIPIEYSHEGEQALETGGGISFALPLIGDQPLIVISADIFCEIPFDSSFELEDSDMHLIMVNNPGHHPKGDFMATELGISNNEMRYTYSGVAYLNPKLFSHEKRIFPLLDKIHYCIDNNRISAEIFKGTWFDVGTARRLHEANKYALGLN